MVIGPNLMDAVCLLGPPNRAIRQIQFPAADLRNSGDFQPQVRNPLERNPGPFLFGDLIMAMLRLLVTIACGCTASG